MVVLQGLLFQTQNTSLMMRVIGYLALVPDSKLKSRRRLRLDM